MIDVIEVDSVFGLRNVSTQKLTALRFGDEDSFRRALRVAAEADIPAHAPGRWTIVVQLGDVGLFERAALAFDREVIADPEKIPTKEYAKLRKRLFGLAK